MKKFETMLAIDGSAAQETLANAMVVWWMARDKEDALKQIEAAPGEDLAGIKNSVIAGLSSLANSLGVGIEQLIEEQQLNLLEKATPRNIVEALNAIHLQWIEDNFTARRWAEKFFKGQLGQYRKTAKLPWAEVEKDFLFIEVYLRDSFQWTEKAVQWDFHMYALEHNADDDLETIAEKARTFAPEIIDWIVAYRDKLDPMKKAVQIADINEFLSKHQNGAEIMEIMIKVVCGE